jgi:hypothetical protein
MDFFGCPIDITVERGQVHIASTSLTENLILPKRLDRMILETDKIPLDLLLPILNQFSDTNKQGIFRRHLIEAIVIDSTWMTKKLQKVYPRVVPVVPGLNVTCYNEEGLWIDAMDLEYDLNPKARPARIPRLSMRPFDMMYRPRLAHLEQMERVRYFIPLRSLDDYLAASRNLANDKNVRAWKGRIESALLDYWENLADLSSIGLPEKYRA